MKFEIDAADMLRALRRVTGIIEKRSTIPVLANVAIAVPVQTARFRTMPQESDPDA